MAKALNGKTEAPIVGHAPAGSGTQADERTPTGTLKSRAQQASPAPLPEQA